MEPSCSPSTSICRPGGILFGRLVLVCWRTWSRLMTPCKGPDLGPDQCCTPAHQRMSNTVNCPRRRRLRRNRCRRQTRTSTGREYWTNAEVPQRPSTLLRPVPPIDSEWGQASGHGPEPPSTEFHYLAKDTADDAANDRDLLVPRAADRTRERGGS